MILILDDHPLARQGLCAIMQMYKPAEEIQQAGTVQEAVAIADKLEVAMAFIDVNLGKESGFDFLLWVREQRQPMKTFCITSSSRQSDFERAKALDVDAYVLKDAFIDEIMYGLKVVERGKKFYSSTLLDQVSQLTEDERVLQELTEREIDVLLLLGQGYSNTKISKTLFISEGTTKKHISNILSKLQLESRVEAALFANSNPVLTRMALSRSIKPDLRREGRVSC